MKVIRADVMGFCMGVRRAVEAADKTLDANKDRKVFSFGPLIHNPVILSKLEEKGLFVTDENTVHSIPKDSVVIIRAHGIRPDLKALLDQSRVEIVDATCPKVVANQKVVKKYSAQGYTIILTGDNGHGEVEGIRGFAENPDRDFFVAGDLNQALNLLPLIKDKKCVLLSQTTFSQKEFDSIAQVYTKEIPDLKVMATICSATCERQQALEKLALKTDSVIIIGGKKSANTIRLFEKARILFKKAVHIETAQEIPDDFYESDVVGITAGASTPDFVIEEVEKALLKTSK